MYVYITLYICIVLCSHNQLYISNIKQLNVITTIATMTMTTTMPKTD